MITDFKGRKYKLIGVDECYTYMKCFKTGDSIKISNDHFESSGFRGS